MSPPGGSADAAESEFSNGDAVPEVVLEDSTPEVGELSLGFLGGQIGGEGDGEKSPGWTGDPLEQGNVLACCLGALPVGTAGFYRGLVRIVS
jgi:hypothetical protein